MNKRIRQATQHDLDKLIRLFIETVTYINALDYSPEQIQAWITSDDRHERWEAKINEQYFIVAESSNGIMGFASLTDKGYLDLLYISKQHQRKGIAQLLFDELLLHAKKAPYSHIFTDASKTAVPFFKKNDFHIVEQQDFLRGQTPLTNFKMQRKL